MIFNLIWWGVIVWVCFWGLIAFSLLGMWLGKKR
jgi:hypothetical protein